MCRERRFLGSRVYLTVGSARTHADANGLSAPLLLQGLVGGGNDNHPLRWLPPRPQVGVIELKVEHSEPGVDLICTSPSANVNPSTGNYMHFYSYN